MKLSFQSFTCSRLALAAAALLLCALPAGAQYLRTSYFLDGAQYRLQLNPAMAPAKGFVHLPGIGHVNASVRSNSLGIEDVIDIVKNSDDADYFASDKFMNSIKDDNHALVNAGTDLLSVGWWHSDRSFWTIGMSVKVDGGLKAHRSLFSFMRDMRGMETNDYSNYTRDLSGQEVNVNAYSEIAVGYTRRFSDHFSAGMRVKGLLGLGNAHFKVNKAVVKTNLEGVDPNIDWSTAGPELMDVTGTASVDVDAVLESSMEGLKYNTSSQGYIEELDFDTGKMGVAGFGAGVDVGVSGRIAGLTLSAALVDLGFIKWSKGSTTVAHANTEDLNFDSEHPGDIMRFADVLGTGKSLNFDMMRLYIDENEAKARTTSLTSSMVLGADYALAGDKVRLGVLYTNYFSKLRNESEVTMSVNYNPSNFVGLAASYSPMLSGGQSFGFALKLGPMFIGTDYMYLGKNTKCCSAIFGLSIPLARRK